MAALIRSILPYVVGLAIAGALYIHTGFIDYTPRARELGPAVWPRLALGLMAAVCLFEIARRLAGGRTETRGVAEALDPESAAAEQPGHPRLVAGGVALVAAYAVLMPILGFVTGTFLFLAAFIYLGGYRHHGVVWAASAGVTILCGILFLRIAYVSLPRGIPPFDRVIDAFLVVPGF